MSVKNVKIKKRIALQKIRKKSGKSVQYEICVRKSGRNMNAYVFNMELSHCVTGFSTSAKEFVAICKERAINRSSVDAAKLFGSMFREIVLKKSKDIFKSAYFNRSIYKYHGKIKSFHDEVFVCVE